MSNNPSTPTNNNNSSKPWPELLPQLQSHINSSRYGKAASLSLKILSSSTVDLNNDDNNNTEETIPPLLVRQTLRKIYTRSMIRMGNYKEALEYTQAHRRSNRSSRQRGNKKKTNDDDNNHELALEEAYCLYRLKKYTDCRALCTTLSSSASTPGLSHLLAQCNYRLNDTVTAASLYRSLLSTSSSSDTEDTLCNLLACATMHHHPYAPTDSPSLCNDSQLSAIVTSCTVPGSDGYNYDVAYNYATYLSLTATGVSSLRSAALMMDTAVGECRLAMEGEEEEEEKEKELAPLRVNRDYTRCRAGLEETEEDGNPVTMSKSHASPAVQNAHVTTVVNDVVRRSRQEDAAVTKRWRECVKRLPSTKNLTPLQTRLVLWNKAVLLQRMGREKESLDVLQELRRFVEGLRTFEGMEPLVKAVMLDCDVLQRKNEDKSNKSDDLTLTLNQIDDGMHPYTKAQAELLNVMVKANASRASDTDMKATTTNALNAILKFPKELQSQPAVMATVTTMRRDLGLPEKQDETQTHKTQSTTQQIKYATFLLNQGNTTEAIKLYETIWKSDDFANPEDKHVCAALMVRAYSYTNPEKAEEMLTSLPFLSNNTTTATIDASQLEQQELPRTKKSLKKLILTDNNPHDRRLRRHQNTTTSHKSRAAILRSRETKKQAHLEKLTAEGRYDPTSPQPPDPERWIPKKMRSSGGYGRRRRRNRGQHSFAGAQGLAGNERDTARLDVKERQREKREGIVGGAQKRSTAHMDVSRGGGNFRRGGRRR